MAREEQRSRQEVLAESKRKGKVAGGAAVVAGVATATVGFFPLGVMGVGATGYYTWRWIKFRMDNGIKF